MSEEFEGHGWVFKYAPKTLDDLVLEPSLKERFAAMIAKKEPQNMTLYGTQGMGKTTLAKIIVSELGDDCYSMFIKCGVNGSVEMVRNQLSDFIEAYQPGKIKIVILDEADSLSGSASGTEVNSAQKALRSVMEVADTIFILTCNHLSNITNALQSRCTPIPLTFGATDVLKRCVQILQAENVKFDRESLSKFYEDIIINNIPDIRSIIRQLELWSNDGTMKPVKTAKIQTEAETIALEIIDILKNTKSPMKASEFYMSKFDGFNGDFELLAGTMFRNLYNHPNAQMILADAIYKMKSVSDPEIQFFAALLQIEKAGGMATALND